MFFFSSMVAADTGLKEVQFKDPWIRTTSTGHPMTAGYLSILNNGSEDVELVTVSSSIASKALISFLDLKIIPSNISL